MLVSMKDMLQHALRDGYAVGQFNINNLEWVGAVLSTAQQCRSPVILGVSGGTVKHMLGLKCIHDIVVNAMEYLHIDVPVALHLDHGTSREACEAAIAAGFSSIMFDGSHLPFRKTAITRHTVTLAHSKVSLWRPNWGPSPAVKTALSIPKSSTPIRRSATPR